MFLIVTINNRLFKGNSWMLDAYIPFVCRVCCLGCLTHVSNDKRQATDFYSIFDESFRYGGKTSPTSLKIKTLKNFVRVFLETNRTILLFNRLRSEKFERVEKNRMRHVKMYTHCFCGNSFRYLLHLHLFHYSARTR